MLNAVGLQNVGVRAFVAERLPSLRQFRTAVIANIFGTTVDEYVEVIRILEDSEGLAAYELNISCPNVKKGGMQYGTDPALTAEVVLACRKASRRPLWVKLSPLVTDITAIAVAAVESGADALTVANTYPAMAVDAVTRTSRLGSVTGGLSGPAIKPLTLRLVHLVSKMVKVPVIGLGGIECATDVCEYLLVGASAVQVGTSSFVDPRAILHLIDALEKRCTEINISKMSDLRGALGS